MIQMFELLVKRGLLEEAAAKVHETGLGKELKQLATAVQPARAS